MIGTQDKTEANDEETSHELDDKLSKVIDHITDGPSAYSLIKWGLLTCAVGLAFHFDWGVGIFAVGLILIGEGLYKIRMRNMKGS